MPVRSYDRDTIAAIATPPGRGGVGVIRVSGPSLGDFVLRLLGLVPQARRATLTDFTDDRGQVIDRGIVLYFPAPNSFTGEDVLELQGHGGVAVMQELLSRCLELGVRLAGPGEFTRRAFLNDKIDLAQAEAVADLIDATTSLAARSAVRSLSGEFSRAIHHLVESLTELRMLIEATLDFPEEDIDLIRDTDALKRLETIRADLDRLLARAKQGAILRSGLHVVLAGLPNVGKSSLLNQLAGSERAIVTDIAGTTRDVLRESIQIEGIPLHVIDTAGLRESDDLVEQLGVERAWGEIDRADAVLQMVDARTGETPADYAISARLPVGAKHIVVENKCDLAGLPVERIESGGQVRIRLSAKLGDGIALLRQELLRVVGWEGGGEDVILARERHLEVLRRAKQHLIEANDAIGRIELCAEELRLAQVVLAEITGEFSADDLLGKIFSSFCIGK